MLATSLGVELAVAAKWAMPVAFSIPAPTPIIKIVAPFLAITNRVATSMHAGEGCTSPVASRLFHLITICIPYIAKGILKNIAAALVLTVVLL